MSEESQAMEHASRRSVLRAAGLGAGATVLAAATMAGGSARGSGVPSPVEPVDVGAGVEGPLVAYLSDVSTGTISLMFDGREIAITDLALARTLASKVR